MRIFANDLWRASRKLLWVAIASTVPVYAQTTGTAPAQGSQPDLEAKIQVLTDSLDQTRAELAESREEIRQLRAMLEQVIQKVGPVNASATSAMETSATDSENQRHGTQLVASNKEEPSQIGQPAQISQDDWQVLNARVEEQAQDKVESNLKYRLKLSGIVLFNSFGVSGQVDNVDVPTVALPSEPNSSGSIGGSLRQSILGLSGYGPEMLGAKTSGDVQVDFFGGLPSGYGSATSGVVRLRLARIRFDWADTSIVGGLDVPFFSPNMPTSYMSIAQPSFAASGNLWTWTPTIRVEQRINKGAAQFKMEVGVMDPTNYVGAGMNGRQPTPGESSRQPTIAIRLSANRRDENRPLSLGVSGIYSPQRYVWGGTNVTGWGGVVDWKIGLIPHTEFSGESFVGKGIDLFGGVPGLVLQPQNFQIYYQSGGPAALAGVTVFGGWSQLKLVINSRNEFNVGLGTGGRVAGDLRYIEYSYPLLETLSPRNDMIFFNYIFRPRSDLVLSPEFRRLRTYQTSSSPAFADQVGVAAGFLF
jgi:hypothetical protein